ncbi:MAG: amino acid--tRNA ligase-related protein, partial [Polyangiales bacterium]
MTDDRSARLRARAEVMRVVRRFFESRDYLEVETPLRVPSPGLDLHLDAFAIEEPHGAPARFLITSPEYQMKRLLSEGLPRIFQICRCFRRGEIGPRHNPEFTMLEWYRAPCSFEELIVETESLVVAVATALRGAPTLHVRDPFRGVDRVVELSAPFERLPIARAFARHSSISEAEALALASSGQSEDEDRFFRVLVDEVEPALAAGPPV